MIALVVNPMAGRGRATERAEAVASALESVDTVRRFPTREAGDECRCAEEAVRAGARIVAVVGGDGTVHHAARGLLGSGIPLAIFAGGTGNDFVKSLGTPAHDIAAMAARVAAGGARVVDVGEIDGVPFVNAAGLGFDVEVLERMRRPSRLRGTAAYVVTSLRALLGYRGYSAHWVGANNVPSASAHLLTVFANGGTFGGTFRIAPTAQLDDGALELVDIHALAPLARPAVFVRAIRGTHLAHPRVTHERGATWTIVSEAPLAFEADGELYRARTHELRVRVRAGALRVVV